MLFTRFRISSLCRQVDGQGISRWAFCIQRFLANGNRRVYARGIKDKHLRQPRLRSQPWCACHPYLRWNAVIGNAWLPVWLYITVVYIEFTVVLFYFHSM